MDDLVGQRFGKLVVVADNGTKTLKNGEPVRTWLCKCDCGNETVVITSKLKGGQTTSCGCNRGRNGEDLIGCKFGRLTVVEYIPPKERKTRSFAWVCKCDCGNDKRVITSSTKLKNGDTKSCGCLKAERMGNLNKKYKYHDRRLYEVYMAVVARTENPNNYEYKNYGARGIKLCDEWRGELGFDAFAEWAYSTGYDSKAPRGECTLDRIDVDGNYSPDNCRWITNKEQQSNRRDNVWITYNGETHTMKQWSEILDIPYKFLLWRISSKNNYCKRTLQECISEYEEYKLKH